MDLSIYVDAIMQKLKDDKVYSEIEEKELQRIIEDHLTNEYKDRVALLQLEMDLEDSKGNIRDVDYYRSKLTEIKSYIISLTRELYKSKKED